MRLVKQEVQTCEMSDTAAISVTHSCLPPGELLHGPHQDHPVQVIGRLLPAHLHQPGAGLVHIPPQHADRDGLHLRAPTPAAIHRPAAPAPRRCLRSQLGAS